MGMSLLKKIIKRPLDKDEGVVKNVLLHWAYYLRLRLLVILPRDCFVKKTLEL